jgi:hypothetical protein
MLTYGSGPNWIHGTHENPILQLAKQTGTVFHAWDEAQSALTIGTEGKPLDPAEAAEYSSLLWEDGLIADAFRYSNEHHDDIDPSRSLYDFFAEQVQSRWQDLPADIAKRKRETFLLATHMWGAYVGSPVTKQSLRNFWLEECIQGENPFVAGTYSAILEAVAAPAKAGAYIRFGKEVIGVESRSFGDQKSKVSVGFSDGEALEFDDVVVTVPLGCLKRDKPTFRPPLPSRLSEAINSIGYGTLDKVYITFPSAFWDTPRNGVHDLGSPVHGALDLQSSTPNVTATTVPLHQPIIGDSSHDGASHLGFIHWLAPSYAADSNPKRWDPQAMNLGALPGSTAHPTLLFYIYGPCSEHMASLVSSAASDSDRDSKLISFFQPYFSRLPGYSASDPACKPRAILATAWASDEYAGYGSYSNFQVGLDKGDQDIEVMREGVPERGIWLAGEHTAPFVALGEFGSCIEEAIQLTMAPRNQYGSILEW